MIKTNDYDGDKKNAASLELRSRKALNQRTDVRDY